MGRIFKHSVIVPFLEIHHRIISEDISTSSLQEGDVCIDNVHIRTAIVFVPLIATVVSLSLAVSVSFQCCIPVVRSTVIHEQPEFRHGVSSWCIFRSILRHIHGELKREDISVLSVLIRILFIFHDVQWLACICPLLCIWCISGSVDRQSLRNLIAILKGRGYIQADCCLPIQRFIIKSRICISA